MNRAGPPQHPTEQFREASRLRRQHDDATQTFFNSGRQVTGRLDKIKARCFDRACKLAVMFGDTQLKAEYVVASFARDAAAEQVLRQHGFSRQRAWDAALRLLGQQRGDLMSDEVPEPQLSEDAFVWVEAAREHAKTRREEHHVIIPEDFMAVVLESVADHRLNHIRKLLAGKPDLTVLEHVIALRGDVGINFRDTNLRLNNARRRRLKNFKRTEAKLERIGKAFVSTYNQIGKSADKNNRRSIFRVRRLRQRLIGLEGSLKGVHATQSQLLHRAVRSQLAVRRTAGMVNNLRRTRLSWVIFTIGLMLAIVVGGGLGYWVQ